jgi:HNH endonuclease
MIPIRGSSGGISPTSNVCVGKIAGSINAQGYRKLQIGGKKKYSAARLAWFYMTGKWPRNEIDHKDCDPLNNRLDNLREATRSENLINWPNFRNKHGLRGVSMHGRSQKFYKAYICVNGKRTYLGSFKSAEEAHAAYCVAAARLHGEFACIPMKE